MLYTQHQLSERCQVDSVSSRLGKAISNRSCMCAVAPREDAGLGKGVVDLSRGCSSLWSVPVQRGTSQALQSSNHSCCVS